MTIDHVGQFIPNMPIELRWLGRLAAPIFLFCLLNGFEKTSNKKKYLLRMYLFGNGMELMNLIANECTTGQMQLTNNMFAVFFSILLSIYLLDKSQEKTGSIKKGIRNIVLWQMAAMFIVVSVISELIFSQCPFQLDCLTMSLTGCIWGRGYESYFAVMGILLYIFKEDKWKFALCYGILSILPSIFTITSFWARVITRLDFYTSSAFSDICIEILSMTISGFGFSVYQIYDVALSNFLYFDYQWMMIFALPFAFLYNGKQGAKVKWSFYLYYPIHILVLFLIGST